MQLIDLLASGLIKDDHNIRLWIYVNGDRTTRVGKWFEDGILKYKKWEVSNATYDLMPNGRNEWLVQLLPLNDAKDLF